MPTIPATHYVPTRFRNLSEEEIGQIQHRLWDLNQRGTDVAAAFNISSATLYRVKNAVPAELVTFDEVLLKKLRSREKRAKKRATRKLSRVA